MFSLIFCSLRATALTFLKNSLKLIKDKTFEIIPKYERTVAKVCLKVAERKIIFEAHQLILVLYFTMLAVMLSELVLIFFFFFFFEDTYIWHLYAYFSACFDAKHLKSLTYHIYFYLDDSELRKKYHSVSQEMMEEIVDMQFKNS